MRDRNYPEIMLDVMADETLNLAESRFMYLLEYGVSLGDIMDLRDSMQHSIEQALENVCDTLDARASDG